MACEANSRSILVTGATGFVGGGLALALAGSGTHVRCLVREAGRAKHLSAAGCEVVEGDVMRATTLEGVGRDIHTAYYLIHAMAGGDGFQQREQDGARNFAQMARREGIGRVVYLGGLGDQSVSKHLLSRHRTAMTLAEHGPPLTYFRAAMV
ncbi:MAG TPA: NAD(P)H-binding protein, partial [Solirubrobacteraceae bacterium]|nr:NAD(P)H-binding protein [Solirubrobacteraceae bacterium]